MTRFPTKEPNIAAFIKEWWKGLLADGLFYPASTAMLVDQPRGKEFEYRVVAVDKSGDGEPSNTVMVVL